MTTVQTIAKKADLPVATVRRILRGENKEVWPAAKARGERVRQIAQQLGYRPNAAARAARSGQFGQLAMLTRRDMGPIQLNLNKGAFAETTRHNLHLSYAEIEFERLDDEDYAPKIMSELCADGFLVHYAWNVPGSSIERIRSYGQPTVWINTKAESDTVYPDDHQGSRKATEALLELGHRRIFFLHQSLGRGGHYSTTDRITGYTAAMVEAGLKPEAHRFKLNTEETQDFSLRVGYWRAVLQQHPDATAVVTSHERVSNPLMLAAASLGLSVPRDLSLVTFSDLGDDSFNNGLPRSVLQLPMQQVGRQAVCMLAEKIAKGNQPCPSVAVPYGQIRPQTMAPPRARGVSGTHANH